MRSRGFSLRHFHTQPAYIAPNAHKPSNPEEPTLSAVLGQEFGAVLKGKLSGNLYAEIDVTNSIVIQPSANTSPWSPSKF
jgi:hypothetical protein